MMRQNKSISIIVPIYNEEKTLPYLTERLSQVFATLQKNYVLNAVLVDDGSNDGSWQVIERICSTDGPAGSGYREILATRLCYLVDISLLQGMLWYV